ncbi:MAG: KH domain-containing protein [Elusimicrobiota bacterium]
MRKFVEYIVKSLVDKPENVDILLDESEIGDVIKIKVADDDKGRIIGKHGKIIKAIRQIVSAGATKNGKKYRVEMEERV